MKTTAKVITVITALMWAACPFALGFALGWGFVLDWFVDFDFDDPLTYRMIPMRILDVLTAIHIALSAIRICSGRPERSGWRKTRTAFNVLFALFWLFIGVLMILAFDIIFTFDSKGLQSYHLLWIPCLTPLATGFFYIARLASAFSGRKTEMARNS